MQLNKSFGRRSAAVLVIVAMSAALAGPARAGKGGGNTGGGGASVDLQVTMSDSPDPVVEGQELTYSISIKNAGKSTATSVVLNDSISAPVRSVTSSQGTCDTSVTCSLGSIAARSSMTVTIVVTADPAFPSNIATVSSSEPDKSNSDNTASTTTTIQSATLEPTTLTAPWHTPVENAWCRPEESCLADATASVDGYLEAFSSIPAGGSGLRQGQGAASLHATHTLTESVSSVSIEISGITTTDAYSTFLGTRSFVDLVARATHSTCADCAVEVVVVPAPGGVHCSVPGPCSDTDDPYHLTIEMTSADGAVPPGDITIRTTLIASVEVDGSGSATADASGWLDQIVVAPAR